MLKEYAEALIVALILAFFIRSFVVQAFKIPSGSMLQTLLIGDHLLVTKFAYGVKIPFTNTMVIERDGPAHGDIIVFEFPEDPSKDFIKRVIATPGDTVEIKDGRVFVNDQLLNEDYILEKTKSDYPKSTVPKGTIFVMGDNRNNSEDSRFADVGFVPFDLIKGKAMVVFWPLAQFKALP